MTPAALNKPLTLPCGATLPNRIAKSAMSESLGGPTTFAATPQLARLYERLGRGGAGLLITGNVMVERGGLGEPGNVVLDSARHLEELKAWAHAAQQHGSKVWMQLNHAGRQVPKGLVPDPVAPSPVALKGVGGMFANPRALREDEVERIIKSFGSAARVAQEAGFDGVQVHGAHGYLVTQFLSPRSNQRTDRWGGSLENRMRFLLEVVRAIRAAVGPRFAVGVKMNSADFQRGGFTLEEAVVVAQALEREGVDLLEVSGGTYEAPAMQRSGEMLVPTRQSTQEREAYFLEYARTIRAATSLPLLLTGGLRTAATMNAVVEDGDVDMVGIARPMAFQPDLPLALLTGKADGAAPVNIRLKNQRLDGLMQIYWYQAQLHRMGNGLEPDATLGAMGVLWHALKHAIQQRPRPGRNPEVVANKVVTPGDVQHAQG